MSSDAPAVRSAERDLHVLPSGRWRVDPRLSTATFCARGIWGTVPARGTLTGLSGTARFDDDGRSYGHLTIPAGTLDSGNRLRDRHLKGADFLHVERHPEIAFAARRIARAERGYVVEGALRVRGRRVELTLPVEIRFGSRIEITGEAVLNRASLGLGHSPLGMIRGPVTVRVELVLERAADDWEDQW